ncbi:MAG: InlB B-repeat-containing protein, partial [Clostridiales Family XIII bacterium]|nr:InlB B-repeat-containing protein [Clostridiales Family XIII bacterium]
MHRISRAGSYICVIALMLTTLAGFGRGDSHGAATVHKVSFYQLSMTAEDGASATPDSVISIHCSELTQWPEDGGTANNPGAVVYAGNNPGNHHFLGWYEFNAPDDAPYDFRIPVTGDLNLFARFTDDHLVTFLNGFGEPFLTKRVAHEEAVAAPTDGEISLFAAPAGMHFDDGQTPGGWKKGSVNYDFAEPVTKDLTLTPTLSAGRSLVCFVSEGTQTPFETVPTGNCASKPPDPTREGYVFSHWSAAEGGAAFLFETSPITEDTTLYAVWTPAQTDYTVVIRREKKGVVGDAGTDVSNYEYAGKFTHTAISGTPMDGIVANARALCAAHAPIPLPAWLEFGFAASTSETVLGNGSTILNVYYKRVVYTFSFTPYSRESGFASTAGATVTIGGKTYTDANRYSFRAKYEQDVSSVWPVQPLAQFAVPGGRLHFQGWKIPNANTTFVSKIVSLSADILPASGRTQTITAYYLSSGITVNLHYMFETPDGKNMPGAVFRNGRYYVRDEVYSQSVFSVGNPFSLKEIKGMEAQTANALQKTADGFAVPPGKPLAEQYLFYNRVRYAVNFDSQGGSPVSSAVPGGFLPGAPLAAHRPPNPTRSGYGFDGWYTNTDDTVRFDFGTETMPDADLMLYAKWIQNPCTVSVCDGLANATLLGTYKRASGEYVGDPQIALAAVKTHVNYTVGTLYPGKGEFLGWVLPLGPGEKTPLSTELPVTEDLVVYADWKPQTFTVTYAAGNAAGGAPPTDSLSYQRGAETRLLAPSGAAPDAGDLVAPQDSDFIGWMDQSGCVHYPGETMQVTGDILLTAHYDVVDKVAVYAYHINYPAGAQDGAGNPIADPGDIRQYVLQGNTFPLIGYGAYSPTPEPESYRFAGWATEKELADAGEVTYAGGTELTAPDSGDPRIEIELWGVWIQYFPVVFDAGIFGTVDGGGSRITYATPGGSSLREQGTAVPTVRVKEDVPCTFMGWALSSDPGEVIDDMNPDTPGDNGAIYSI